ncbi:MAG: DUF2510 domain-containing protein, partial [Ilumatobacteraceae bacterium]
MQEFESISASSYDPSALATKLTAKAAEGWSVVAIVPTGGDVTAFVSRDKGGADESTESKATESTESSESTEPAMEKGEEATPAHVLPAKSEPTPEPKAESASEPSGWAIAPEPATPTPEPASVVSTIGITPTSTHQPAAAPVAAVPAAAAPDPDPAPAPAVPAGWYADPAGRFELRYWDGSTWTEHVSRAGQQFT